MNNLNHKIYSLQNQEGSNILTFASGKGGVGKTWLATTIADNLGKKKKKILLFDGDLGLANIDIQLGINPDKDLAGVIMKRYSFEEAIINLNEINFDLIAGKSGSGVISSLEMTKITSLKNELIKQSKFYDYVIIDLAAGIDNPIRALTSQNGTVYIITTSDPTSLTDAYAFIKLTTMKYPNIAIKVIVNMASSNREGLETFNTLFKSCLNFLKINIELSGIVRSDKNVREAIKNQKLFLKSYPYSNAAKDIEILCKKIASDE